MIMNTIKNQFRDIGRVAVMLLLAMSLVPQHATAADSRQDYESNYVGRDWYWGNSWNTVYVTVTYWNDYGTDEGWCDSGGLHIKASKDGGSHYDEIGQIKTSSSGGLTLTGSLQQESSGSGKYDKWVRVKWAIPRQWRNCNIKIKCEGNWSDYDGKNCNWKSTEWSFTSSYTHTVRQINWNTDFSVAADGTVTVPYSFSGSCNTDGDTHICTRINGGYNGTIGYKSPASNYAAGSYVFNLNQIGMNMRSEFTIQPYHEFTHNNDKDANNGIKYYQQHASVKTFLPMPLATLENPVFSQVGKSVTLKWTADNTNYGNGKWAIYRNGTFLTSVPQNTYTYTDTTFPNESDVNYYIYYVANGWAETAQRSELKSNEKTVGTTRTVPISNPNAECQADRIVFTWASDGYPQGWGNQFKIYVNNETTPIYTITPTAGQTSFRWEHRTTNQHNDRQSNMDGTIHYTEEPLNACSPHTYRIEGVIGTKVFSSKTYEDRAIGTGTLFYNFEATKGAYPGTVKLNWHVDRQGSTAAKTYIVDRRRTDKDDEAWTNLYRTSSTDEYLFYTDDTPLPGVFYDYRVTVEDKCDNGIIIPNDITDIGFAQTTGTMSGRITFGATGSSVANVDVEARRTGASNNVEAQYHAMRFTGDNGAVIWEYPSTTYAADKLSSGDFTIQLWVNPEELGEAKILRLNGETCYVGMNNEGKLALVDGSTTYTFDNAVLTAGQYNHVVLTRSGTTVTASVVGTDAAGEAVLNSSTQNVPDGWTMTGAEQLELGHFIGYVDEFRLWTKALTEAEILENYDHLLVGNEKQLETYWTFDEGLRRQFFDYSRDGTVYHQHHGKTSDGNAEPSNQTPTQLKLKAKTDADGNYIIQGVPFSGEGTTYAVIPTLGIHQFNPMQQLRFVGNNSLVHNGTDFTDISSFPVRGKIRYANTDYPVEGVNFYVDGQICAKEGQPITTNAYGEYEISVPIGEHYITVAKQGHEFADGGRYPADPNKTGTLVNYNDAVSNLDFEDVTLVTVAGRVTGGKIEEEKPLGFGESVNNIGQATITLGIDGYHLNVVRNVQGTTVNYDTAQEDLAVSSPTEDVNSVTVRQGMGTEQNADLAMKVIIKTDPQTGEFAALLPPIAYRVEKIEIPSNPSILFDGLPVIYADDPTQTSKDSLVTDDGTKKEFEYVAKMIQSYYTDPVLEVTQKGRTDGSFGEQKYTYSDKLTQQETEVPLYTVTDGSPVIYAFGYPLFKQQNTYIFNVRGYETYVNKDDAQNPVTYEVPLRDVPVTFSNQMGTGQQVVINPELTDADDQRGDLVGDPAPDQVTLDENGEAQYEWMAGMPNITSPYTLSLAATFVQNDRTYTWDGVNATNSLAGVVTGALPTGTNFVTSGPDQVTMILRDPAGTASQAYWEAGNTVTSTLTTEQSFGNEREEMTHTEIGVELTTFTGAGIGAFAGVIQTNKQMASVDLGIVTEISGATSNSMTFSSTTTKRVSTSDQPEYVGAQGDVFIGNATNILFGNARSVGLKKDGGNYSLTAMDNYVTGQEFGTTFNYTQNYIENVMIPNFISLRNSYLSKGVDDEGMTYTSTVEEDDDNYGAKGYYTCTKPASGTKPLYTDSVAYYNEQIKNWVNVLAYNEQMKVKAIDNRKTYIDSNQSFDSGTFIEASTTYTTGITQSYTTNFEAHVVLGLGTDITVFGQDVNVNVQNTVSYGNSETTEGGYERTVTTGYTLMEAGDDDALTVDVYKAPDGMGAIFVTRGGQTTCPYEGEQKTKYFEPGMHTIATATMQIEKPVIAVEDAANNAGGVPAGKRASYNLLLTNESETGEDCYFDLFVIDETNTEGAKLTINGEPFGNGRAVLVPAGGTVRMNLELAQNNTGGLTYEDIAVVLASQCQKDPASTWEVIGDTVYISAEFVPTSTDVALRIDNAVVNTSTKGMLPLTVSGYDPNYDGLKYIAVQYQGVGETAWHDARKYVMTENDIVNAQIEEVLPTSGIINLNFDMTNSAVFPDRTYKFRALSARTYGNGDVTNVSQEIQVVKDMSRPKPLGQPQPTDGILSAGDELSILFNENILSGELTKDANFLVTGVLNGSELAHSTALELENTDQAAATEANITLANKSFAADMWLKADGKGTILSHGTGAQKMSIGLNAEEQLEVTFEGETYTSLNKVPQQKWTFLTLSYEKTAAGGKLSAQVADDANTTVLFDNLDVVAYEGTGPLAVGQQMKGAIHELLLWDEAHDIVTALQQRSVTKSPATRHLIGYWKMDEGEGTQINDYARNRHMTMAAETWHIENENKAVSLDGTKHLGIATGEIPPMPEDDYAVELWVKADQQTGETQLLQGGEVSLWINSSGLLQLTSGASTIQAGDKSILDNAWHHVALNMLRQGNTAVYVDGETRATIASTSIGTIASDSMIIGARRTVQDLTMANVLYKYDRQLKGTIDEVRIWNATKNADQLRKARKLRLTGQEPGLAAYYPFEVKTLNNFNQVVTNGSDADLTGSNHQAELSKTAILDAEYVDEAPALRLKPEETNVRFSFTSSNNKIVIDIDETPAKIEGCTLNFTVRSVHDQNGNLSEPVTWSAYVNQNTLVWTDKELSVTTPSNVEAYVTTAIENKGGTVQNWMLSGMPSWIEASMEYGQLSALSEQDITFIISEATPIGKYEETIYLKGNDGIETPLTLHINVTGTTPEWSVRASDYENSMNVIGQLNVLNVPTEDTEDIVAAFVGSECRGVAHPVYKERYDNYFVTLDIYGNASDEGEPLTIRVFDASTGITYPVVQTSVTLNFESNALKGTYQEPVKFNAMDLLEQTKSLSKGWNWLSFYVKAEDMTLPTVFAEADNVTVVKSQRTYMQNAGDGWKGRTMTLNNQEMYKVQASEAQTLSVIGDKADTQQAPISLMPGWNWVAYNGTQNMSVANALADFDAQDGDIIKAQRGFANWDGYEWSGSLKALVPGEGYMIKSTKEATFSYPSAVAPARARETEGEQVRLPMVFAPTDYHQFSENMTMVAQVRINGLPAADVEVGVFAGDQCRTAEVSDANGIVYLTIPGEGYAQLTLRATDGQTTYTVEKTLEYANDQMIGSTHEPFIINFDITGISTVENGTGGDDRLYDLQGRRVQRQAENTERPTLRKGVYIENGQKRVIK